MKYPYIHDADEKLRKLCENKLEEKYKEDLSESVRQRLNWELSLIEKYRASSAWLTVYDALKAVGAEEKDYCFRGSITSLVVSFLLDFTTIDPICCKPKLYPEFAIDDKKERLMSFEVNVILALNKKLVAYFEEYSSKEKVSRRFFEEGLQYGVYIGDGQSNDYYGNSFENFPTDVFYFCFIPVDREKLQANINKDIVSKLPEPETFEDYVKCYGLTHSTGVWEDNAENLIEKEIVSLKDVIAYHEDVFELLLQYGVDRESAFVISDYVKKGLVKKRGWKTEMLQVMNESEVPSWFVESCAKVVYLFPRAHGMNFVKNYCWEC